MRAARAARAASAMFTDLGPGVITGAADDDPSGIATYTVAGASQGYAVLWTSPVSLPLLFAVQVICARIGLVTGRGLAAAIRARHGRPWLAVFVVLLTIANVVNIGADLAAIAAGIALLVPIPEHWLVAPVGVGLAMVEILVPYGKFVRWLKGLTLFVFSYVLAAFFAHVDWGAALRGTLIPSVPRSGGGLQTMVALLGTTISPYLFFWQASEEVEEERALGLDPAGMRPARLSALVARSDRDVGAGTFLSCVGFYFVVLVAAATLHGTAAADVQTAADAARALQPLAGDFAAAVFAIGFIAMGLLAVPVLAGSTAYAAAELFDWREGLSETFRRAPQFYAVIGLATLVGVAIVLGPVGEIEALYVAAIVNGVAAPPILVMVLLLARDPEVLGVHRPGPVVMALGWLAAALMTVAAVGMLVA